MLFNLYQQPGWMILALFVVSAWMIVWKGLGLWYAAKNKQKGWFIVLLIFNTLGLLPIIYLLWFKPKEVKAITKKKGPEVVVKKTNSTSVKKKPVRKKVTKRKKK